MKLRDKLWLCTFRAHNDDRYYALEPERRIGCWSRITPAEGAHMLGIKNVIMVMSDGIPVPFSVESEGYVDSFYRMNNVWWSVTGCFGFRLGLEEDYILKISENDSKINGAFAYDLLNFTKSDEEVKSILETSKEKLEKNKKNIELWASVQFDASKHYSDSGCCDALDGVVVCNKYSDEIPNMEKQFEEFEKLFPGKKKMLGINMYDYLNFKALTANDMEFQLNLGKKLIKEGRIEGMVIHTNCNLGLGFDSEFYTRKWVDDFADEEI